MTSFLISFVISFLATMIVLRLAHHGHVPLDNDLTGVQKFHARIVPRIGGLPLFIASISAGVITYYRDAHIGILLLLLMASSAVAFLAGLTEDLTGKVRALHRLLLTMVSAAVGVYLLNAVVVRVDVAGLDMLMQYRWVAIPLTVVLVAGIANAVNLIDGFNGLASVVTMFMLFSLGYVAWQVNDVFVMTAALVIGGAIAGFLLWNYPFGLIFLGDGGAYFVGFMLAELAILLVARNPQVSAWYPALLLVYPAFETMFSIYRRLLVRRTSPGIPDGIHLHSLIFRRIVRWAVGYRDARMITRSNSLTSPYLWALSLLAVVPATLFWRHPWMLLGFFLIFVFSYVWLYLRIVRFKVPGWMAIKRRNKK